jgi:hypothetical protein
MATEYQLQNSDETIGWFLDNVIIADIGKVIDAGAGYLAFALIAQAIETLGALLDERDFSERSLSESRFGKAITELFSAKYGELNKSGTEFYLYEHLRCGMAHILRPNSRIVFCGAKDAKQMGHGHLEVLTIQGYSETQLLLVLETFYEDLKDACGRAKNLIKKKTHPKLKQGYITVSRFTYHFTNAESDYALSLQKGASLNVTTPATNNGFTISTAITGARG